MRDYAGLAAYGVAIWAAVFVVAIIAFPLRAGERPLFESIMPVALALAVVVAAGRFFRGRRTDTMDGLRVGALWLAINVVVDLLAFSWGPMQMSLADYVKDIGLTYLMIPIITTGIGSLARRA